MCVYQSLLLAKLRKSRSADLFGSNSPENIINSFVTLVATSSDLRNCVWWANYMEESKNLDWSTCTFWSNCSKHNSVVDTSCTGTQTLNYCCWTYIRYPLPLIRKNRALSPIYKSAGACFSKVPKRFRTREAVARSQNLWWITELFY